MSHSAPTAWVNIELTGPLVTLDAGNSEAHETGARETGARVD